MEQELAKLRVVLPTNQTSEINVLKPKSGTRLMRRALWTATNESGAVD